MRNMKEYFPKNTLEMNFKAIYILEICMRVRYEVNANINSKIDIFAPPYLVLVLLLN